MTLQNLLRIGKLKVHVARAADVRRLLAVIDQNLADSASATIGYGTRFDAAYKAVMQCALVAMMASGYRPSTNEPGHHQVMIQSLPLTLGTDNEVWVLLDALRRQRNANDYTGHPITPEAHSECLAQAKSLSERLHQWLAAHHAKLLP